MLDEVLRRSLAIDRSKTNQALWRIEIGEDGRDRVQRHEAGVRN